MKYIGSYENKYNKEWFKTFSNFKINKVQLFFRSKINYYKMFFSFKYHFIFDNRNSILMSLVLQIYFYRLLSKIIPKSLYVTI